MINCIVMLCFFLAGVLTSWGGLMPASLSYGQFATWVFYGMLVLVGVGVGSNDKALSLLRHAGWRIAVVPATVLVGTLAGAAAASLITSMPVFSSMAVGAGFGYYSLSSILITQMAEQMPAIDKSLAVVALLSNIAREVLTLVASPLLAKYLGGYAPIAVGGATTMDSTLAVVTRFSGKQYMAVALLSGVVLTFIVPVLVPAILKLAALTAGP